MTKIIYELSGWIKNDVDENNFMTQIKKLLEDFKFELINEQCSKTKKLAYPIKKEEFGKFFTFYFYGNNKDIENFKNKIKKINEILRFIILKRKYLKIKS